MESQSLMAQYQIEPYRGDPKRLRQIAVAFTGSLQKSSGSGKVLLLNDPMSQQAFFYEFRTADIAFVEECPSIAMPDGTTVSMVRAWVKKGATALRIEPFHVQDTATAAQEYF